MRSDGGMAQEAKMASILSASSGDISSADSYGTRARTRALMSLSSGHASASAVGTGLLGFFDLVGFLSVVWSAVVPKEGAFC